MKIDLKDIDLPSLKDFEQGPLTMEKSHEAYTGHTQDSQAQRDFVKYTEPAMPGSSTGEAAISTFMGTPGQDYEASWGISVSFKILI